MLKIWVFRYTPLINLIQMDELMNYRTNELPPAATQWFLYQSLVWVFGTKTVTRGGVLLAIVEFVVKLFLVSVDCVGCGDR